LPVQLLWVNMMTSIFLGLMLVFEAKEPDLMFRPPRDPKRPLLTFALMMRSGLVCLIMLTGAYWLFFWEMNMAGGTIAEARTAVINVIVAVEIGYLLNCRSLNHSLVSIGPLKNPWVIAGSVTMLSAQIFFTYVPLMNNLFHTAPIRAESWLRILAVAASSFVAVEFEKWIRFGRQSDNHVIPE
jgi:cation-transporting ATPase F